MTTFFIVTGYSGKATTYSAFWAHIAGYVRVCRKAYTDNGEYLVLFQ